MLDYAEEGVQGFVTADLASPGEHKAPHVLAFQVHHAMPVGGASQAQTRYTADAQMLSTGRVFNALERGWADARICE